jgi:hypothetical protein
LFVDLSEQGVKRLLRSLNEDEEEAAGVLLAGHKKDTTKLLTIRYRGESDRLSEACWEKGRGETARNVSAARVDHK